MAFVGEKDRESTAESSGLWQASAGVRNPLTLHHFLQPDVQLPSPKDGNPTSIASQPQ
jgi:hypothetical protein